ncbi:hypothetical protein GCM10023192_42360 [Amycolatopsis samaneae]
MPCEAAVESRETNACVDLSARKAWLLARGKVLYGPVPMLPGRKDFQALLGTFHVLSKEKLHRPKERGVPPITNSVFFRPGEAFHFGSLTEYTHGGIHLSFGASVKFFKALRVGDLVQIVR